MQVWAMGVALALALFITGCKGVPGGSEKEARRKIQDVSKTYRPNDRKPPLPILTTNSSLADYLTFALLNQPSVESAYYEWAASVERITTARSLPDPQLTFQMDIQNVVSSVMPGLMASFPWLGKLRGGAAVASAESQARYFAFQTAVLRNAFDVKKAYFQLYYLDEKIRVNRENLKLLAELEELARTQNEVGKVTLQDVLRAQIEQARLGTAITNLEDSRTSFMTQFKAALGLKMQEPTPPMPRQFETTSLDLTADTLLETAMSKNTRLKALESEVRAAEVSIALARKSRLPDFSLGLMADAQMDPTVYRPLGTMTLPIWRDKIAAQMAEAQAGKRTAEARLSNEQITLTVNFADRNILYREATRNLELLKNQLLPKARQSFEVARAGYLSGQIDFFNLVDTERTVLEFELERVDASMQREIVLAELSLIIAGMPPVDSSGISRSPEMPGGKNGSPQTQPGGM